MSTAENELAYRRHVERYADLKAKGLTLDDLKQHEGLDRDRVFLKLSPDQARSIEQAVWAQAPLRPSSSVMISNDSAATVLSSKAQRSFPVQQLQPSTLQVKDGNAQARSESLGVTSEEGSGKGKSELKGEDSNLTGSQPSTSKQVDAFDPEETAIPPDLPEDYFAHRQQYGKAFLQALQAEGFNLGDETRERLRKLAIQLELSGGDVADIERTTLVEVYLTRKPPATAADEAIEPGTAEPEEKYDLLLQPLFDELTESLKAGDFKSADIATFEVLKKLIRPAEDWLDEDSLMKFLPTRQDKTAIQEIDRLWAKHSNGKFGFSRQLELYPFDAVPTDAKELDKARREHRRLALAFSRNADWWHDGLEFFKYYNQLEFTAEASQGHLPAWWFWKIPRQKVFLYGGLGLLKERGGCRVDAYTLPAFMYLLKKCGIKSAPTSVILSQ